MAEGQGGEKTEQPTSKRREDARKEGNVFQSKDVATVVILFAVFYLLRILFPYMYRDCRAFLEYIFDLIARLVNGEDPVGPPLYVRFLYVALKSALPLLLVTLVLGVLAPMVQTGFNFSTTPLKPKLSRFNPINGIKRVFSLRNLVELFKNLLKIAIMLVLIYNLVWEDILPIARMMDMDLIQAAAQLLQMIFDLVVRVCMAFVVIAFFDYLYQRWDYERNLKMTKQEVKDEYKQTEGNPQIKSRIRGIMRQRAQQRMIQNVPEADVIIRNPTHLAIALKYEPEKHPAPVVLAMGQGYVALRIVKAGEEHGVAVLEEKALARAMYPYCELGKEIPPDFYGAVAEILVYIYKQQHREEMFEIGKENEDPGK